jgi:hypothetical protein
VITAYLISRSSDYWRNDVQAENAAVWLAAVERAGVAEVELAEHLALSHYQAGNFDAAQRWVKRAPNLPVSKWIQAKLFLRAGKPSEAAKLLAQITRTFPLVEPTNAPNVSLHENVYLSASAYDDLSAGRQVLGELGALRLHRREYTQALDALLRAGFWSDSAYVAERVLSLDELKSYVDANWPEVATDTEEEKHAPANIRPSKLSREIRYLLARRLVRNERRLDARQYLPDEWTASLDRLNSAMAIAEDGTLPNDERATNYYIAAWITRTNGMELMGTEGAPDFTIWGGNYEYGPTIEEREELATNAVAGASHDEIQRARVHTVTPGIRWHYRNHAAALAYEGARLLPDNDPRTARMLYSAGRWAQDLGDADIFYKMLVRRCRKTELGKAADEWRWFPRLDENDKPLPRPHVVANLDLVPSEVPDAPDPEPENEADESQ